MSINTQSNVISLGIISYVQQGTRFYGQILETTTIFDIKHERNFVTSLDWIDYLQTKYPSTNPSDKCITKTVHELCRKYDQKCQ